VRGGSPRYGFGVRRMAIALLGAFLVAAPAAAAPPRKGIFAPGKSLGNLRLGATPAQVKAAWGSRYGRCRGCPRTTWYFTYRRYKPQGAGVQFRRGRVEAIFTLWAPPGWRTTRGLYIGDNVTHLMSLYGTLARADCPGNYYALTMPSRGGVSVFYVVNEKIFGFALLSFQAAVCR
jgi:hypothetical protein